MLIVAVTLIGVAAAAAFSLVATPQYEAKTKLYVSVHTDSQATGDLVQGSNFARQNMATLLLIALAPLLLTLALIVKLDSDGHIIFKQRRVGTRGTSFYMWKFRSMVLMRRTGSMRFQTHRTAMAFFSK